MNYYIRIILFCSLMFSRGISGGTEYGMKLGLTTSNINYTNRVETHITPDKPYIWMHEFKPRAGINIALLCGYNISSRMYVGIEPGYILKGAKFELSSAKLDLQYINLPLAIKFKAFKDISIVAGPEFSKLIKAKIGSNDLSQFYNKQIETSIFAGLEYNIMQNLLVGGRINYGITKVSETQWMNEENVVYGSVGEINNYAIIYVSCIQ